MTKPPSLALKAIIERAKSKVKAKGRQAQKPPRHTRELSPPTIRVEHRTYVFDETGEEMPYALAMPRTDPPQGGRPLLLALHGLATRMSGRASWSRLALLQSMVSSSLHRSATLRADGMARPISPAEDIGAGEALVRRCDERPRASSRRVQGGPETDLCMGFSMGGGGALHFAVQNTHPSEGLASSRLRSPRHARAYLHGRSSPTWIRLPSRTWRSRRSTARTTH